MNVIITIHTTHIPLKSSLKTILFEIKLTICYCSTDHSFNYALHKKEQLITKENCITKH